MSFLFNPYRKIAGAKALMIGLLFALVTVAISPFSNAAFDGVLDFHKIRFENWWVYPALYLISWIVLVLTFGIAAILFSKSNFRWIDILGTSLLARAPLLFVAILAFLIQEIQIEDLANITSFHLSLLSIIAIIIVILCIIWMVALLFNAYKVALNIKGNKLIWSFIITLLASEILSVLILHYLNPFLN